MSERDDRRQSNEMNYTYLTTGDGPMTIDLNNFRPQSVFGN